MQTSKEVGKELMLKLRESFSQKSFSSTSYQSSLICSSKTIRMDCNLTSGVFSSLPNTFSASNFTARHLCNASKKTQETSSINIKNLEDPDLQNRLEKSSRAVKKPPARKKNKKLLTLENSLNSPAKDANLELKISTKHSDQSQASSGFKSFQCDVCLKYFASKRGVQRHSILHSSERHPCKSCGKVFQTRENLMRHHKAIHEVKVKSIKCSQCYKAFSRQRDLNIHLKKHPYHVQQSSSTVPSTSIDVQSDKND